MRWSIQHEQLLETVKELPNEPGVYRFFDKDSVLLYVGKAKNLKARVRSYFASSHDHPKVNAMVQRICSLEVTLTTSELEALLLEFNLIKTHRPPYNILLKDGKSYPYLFLSQGKYPRLIAHRGTQKAKGQYFGPYPNAKSVYEALTGLQKIGQLRNCSDSEFKSRKRPCLQFQIKRCSAPCVGFVDPEKYQQSVKQIAMVLNGKDDALIKTLVTEMQAASTSFDYEQAGEKRDLIAALQKLRSPQGIVTQQGNVDVIVLVGDGLHYCAVVLMIREGRILGHRPFFLEVPHELAIDNMLQQFILQHYLAMPSEAKLPNTIVLAKSLNDDDALVTMLSEHAGHKIKFAQSGRSALKQSWIEMAEKNAKESLHQRLASKNSLFKRFEALTHLLKSEVFIERIDCFDISHFQGDSPIGSCVACGLNGPIKSGYRRYGVQGVQAGDDYAALFQVLKRHYSKLDEGKVEQPHVLLIDGGKGQMLQAEKMVAELGLSDILVMSIAKGTARKPGLEQLHIAGEPHAVQLTADSDALHLLQFARDEAHRFAITAHRKRRDNRAISSVLEQIEGLGKLKRRHLLAHFGGLQGVKEASLKALCQVPGIGPKLAKAILEHLKQQ